MCVIEIQKERIPKKKAYQKQYHAKKPRAYAVGEHLATPKASTKPALKDLAWAAGFIEGEGTFSMFGRDPGTSMSASQVNRQPLERLQEFFGGSIRKQIKGRRGNAISVWKVSGARARGIMFTLWHWLSDRRRKQVRGSLGSPVGAVD